MAKLKRTATHFNHSVVGSSVIQEEVGVPPGWKKKNKQICNVCEKKYIHNKITSEVYSFNALM